ncbi:hypothetical protein JKP88DRAFT_233252, partial [Tribonema minus]
MGAKEKAVVGGFLTLTLAAIGVTHIYLPYYSDAAKQRRQKVATGELDTRNSNLSAGSMWSNIDDAAKANSKPQERR